jgi:glycosyltransferase involved in cell wall biosynthesis
MPYWLNAADVLLVTSSREGSPVTVREALACGLPVVSVDVGDVAARIADAPPSRIVSSSHPEALAAALFDALDAECGRRSVESPSVMDSALELTAVYRRLAQR